MVARMVGVVSGRVACKNTFPRELPQVLTRRELKRLGDWMSKHDIWALSSNAATMVSVDLVPGSRCDGGTCLMTCTYCYARRGKQSMSGPRALQVRRTEAYIKDPAGFARQVAEALREVNRWLYRNIPGDIVIGSPEYPLRLWGAGDGVDAARIRLFLAALDELGIAYFAFSRLAGRLDHVLYSADNRTPQSAIARAVAAGRRVVFMALPGDVVPSDAWVVFPEHRARNRVARHPNDCFKLRHDHGPGICYRCRRCM